MAHKAASDEFIIDVSRYRTRAASSGGQPETLALVAADGKLTPVETRVLEQALEKALLMRVEEELALAGGDFMSEIDRHTGEAFAQTLDFFRELSDVDRPEEDQHNLDAMRKVLTQLAADHLIGANKMGAAQIGQIMQRPVSTEDTRGLAVRLLALLGR